MKRSAPTVVVFCAAAVLAMVPAAHAQQAYVLRDTTAFPPPAAGRARLFVAREREFREGLKPEFIFVDGRPFGMLPPQTAATGEITPGWHRIWLGRGSNAQMWFEAAADARYLVRMREDMINGTWHADLVRDSRDGYRAFAKKKGLKLSVITRSGTETLQRNLNKLAPDAQADSIARADAQSRAQLPIVITDAWYADPSNPRQIPSEYDTHPGQLTVDAQALHFTRGDTTVVEIPRSSITLLRYGGMKHSSLNPWLLVYFKVNGSERGASFTDPARGQGSKSYNRIFNELEKTVAAP